MLFLALAKEYAGVCLFNKYTYKRTIGVADIFIKRSGVTRLVEIDLKALTRFKGETLKEAKPITFNGHLKYLRLIGEYAVRLGYMESNPFKLLPLAPIGAIPPKTIELDHITELNDDLRAETAKHQQGWFWSAVIETFYFTGMRRRQLVSLKMKDLDFKRNLIRLTYEGSKTHREWEIPMHPKLKPTLRHLVTKTEIILRRKLKASDYVFRAPDLFPRYVAEDNGQMKPESITGFFKRLSKRKRILVGAHRFRHTVATELCNPPDSNPDLFAVQELLGHANINTTRGYVNTKLRSIGRVLDSLHL
ncbi:MAG TPA: site-specific integrase [Cellvibrio sp.]|nr:site-specific integrase [Cellvibrio sp.]